MNNKKFFLSLTAYIVITFPLAFTWHLMLFDEVYRSLNVFSRIDDPIIPLGILSMLIQGAILAYLYPLFYRGRSSILQGIRYGVLMGLFLTSANVIAMVAKVYVSSYPTWFILEYSFAAIQFIASGAAIGYIHGRKK